MTSIIATGSNIIFEFEDKVTVDGLFNENTETSSLIYIPPTPSESGNKNRWVKVKAVGPDVTVANVGDRVLVSQGMWTVKFLVDGKRYWKSEQQYVIATDDK